MTILLLLIPVALLLGLLGVWAFMWAIGSGQFNDLDAAGSRVLFDDADARLRERRQP
ncbi:MAG: cbb3-type cytochrome oxidase assembly protein CcoS [Ferrovibrio sp.]